MKIATDFQAPQRTTKARPPAKTNVHDDGGRVMGARMVLLTDVPPPQSPAEVNGIIDFAMNSPSSNAQLIRVFCSPRVTPEDFMGRDHIRTRENVYAAGPDRLCLTASGVRVFATEYTQARQGLHPDRMKTWPLGKWHGLGNVLSQLLTGDPVNRWTNAVVAIVRIAADNVHIVAYHMPEMQPKYPSPYSGVVAVVRIPGAFERIGRATVSLLSGPWANTRIRQPEVP